MAVVQITNPKKATVHIYDYVPRKVGVRSRQYLADLNEARQAKGLEPIDFKKFKDVEKEELESLPMDYVVAFENFSLHITQNMIEKIAIDGGAEIVGDEVAAFLDNVDELEFKEIAETSNKIYAEKMEKLAAEKKTN